MTCLMCGYPIREVLSLKQLFDFSKLSKKTICKECLQFFKKQDGTCLGCQKVTEQSYCQDCLEWERHTGYLPKHHALYCYDQFFKEWLESFKFKGHYHLASIFKEQLKLEIKKYNVDYIVPIPITAEKLQTRGFNQVEVLLDFAEIGYHTILNKGKEFSSQVSRNKIDRINATFNFIVQQDYVTKLAGKSVLVIDDVYTTGSTLQHASVLFYESKVASVQTFSLAR